MNSEKVRTLKIVSIVIGILLFLLSVVVLVVSAPESISDESMGCEVDAICNCKCPDGESDSDCRGTWQILSVMMMMSAVIVGVLPVAVIEHMTFSKYAKMEIAFPRFMKDFSESVKGGMTIPQALSMASNIDYGELSTEIKKTDYQLSWGLPFPKAIENFSGRIKGSTLMKQAFTIIIESFRSGGNIANTMDSIAQNIGLIKEMEDEKQSILSQQIYILYFIFFMFLAIIVMLYKLIIPMLTINFANPTEALDPSANCKLLGLPSIALCSVGRAFGLGCEHVYFVSLFLFMCLIQGVSSGILAGFISTGRVAAGIKHAAIMVIATVFVFMVFV